MGVMPRTGSLKPLQTLPDRDQIFLLLGNLETDQLYHLCYEYDGHV